MSRRFRPIHLLAVLLAVVCGALGWFTQQLITVNETLLLFSRYEDFRDRDISFTADFYGLKYSGTTDNLIDRNILYFGAFEKPVLLFLEDLARALAKDDLVFVDVGANTGQHTLFMSRLAAQVHAVEPYPPVLDRLRRAVEANGLSNVTIHPVGFGAQRSEFTFYEPAADNHGVGSFVKGFRDDNVGVRKLPIVIGDEYLAEHGLAAIDILKVDVEGYEKPVLEGMRELLETHRPVIAMEITIDPEADGLFTSLDGIRNGLPVDYAFLDFNLDGAAQVRDWYSLREFRPEFDGRRQYNIVAYPRERDGAIPRSNREEAEARVAAVGR